MKTPVKIIILLSVLAAAGAAVVIKEIKSRNATRYATAVAAPKVVARLPKLLDLGANKCVSCKMMTPILEDLKKEYAGRMTVEFIDVWQHEDAGKSYQVEIIPTQIFFDADGKELFRHEGFFSKEDILAKWKELGVTL